MTGGREEKDSIDCLITQNLLNVCWTFKSISCRQKHTWNILSVLSLGWFLLISTGLLACFRNAFPVDYLHLWNVFETSIMYKRRLQDIFKNVSCLLRFLQIKIKIALNYNERIIIMKWRLNCLICLHIVSQKENPTKLHAYKKKV